MNVLITEQFSAPTQICIGIVLYLISVFGTVGNLILIIALRKNKRLKNANNLLTVSLAGSDILISAIAMPISGFAALNFKSDAYSEPSHYGYKPSCAPQDVTQRLHPFLCTLNGLIIYFSSRISTWTLAGMALERYIAVLHPLNYNRMVTKTRIVVFIVMIWIVSLVVELPQVSGWFPFVYYNNAFGCLSPSYHHMAYNQMGFITFSISKKVLLTLLPTPLIGFCYYRIFNVSFKTKQHDVSLKRRYTSENGNLAMGVRDKITTPSASVPQTKIQRRMTVSGTVGELISRTSQKYSCYKKSFIWFVVVISYVICWSPVSVTGISMNFLDAYCEVNFPRGFIISVFVLAVMNSCLNPVIYGLLHQQIRRTFYDILCCRSIEDRLRYEEQSEYLGNASAAVTLNTVRTLSTIHPLKPPSLVLSDTDNTLLESRSDNMRSDKTLSDNRSDKILPDNRYILTNALTKHSTNTLTDFTWPTLAERASTNTMPSTDNVRTINGTL